MGGGFASSSAIAQSTSTSTVRAHLAALSEAELDERLAFIEDRVADQFSYAQLWWWTFTTTYSVGVVAQSVRATIVETPAWRADLILSAIKATGGVLRFALNPYGGLVGTDEFAMMPSATLEQKRTKLARAEAVLRANAKATVPYGRWYAHVANVVVNLVGATIVGLGFDDWPLGLTSAALGIGVGEISFIIQPWEADEDLDEYRAKFGVPGRFEPATEKAAIRARIHVTGFSGGLGAAFTATF